MNRLSRLLIPTLAVILICAALSQAGIQDRFSGIELLPRNLILFPQIAAPDGNPTTDQGWLYVKDNGGNTNLYFEDDAGTVTSLTASASGVANLDEAYDGGGAGAGRAISVDQGPVLLTGTNAVNNTLELTGSGSGHLLNFTNTGTGRDISGTSASWYFTSAGVLSLANGLTIDNGTNNVLEINENSEDLLLTFGTNLLDLSTTTGIVQIDLFDGAATTITKAADGAADDITISVTGAQNSSLHLASSGTAADAITLITSAGGIDITVAGAAAGEDIDISTNTSINLAATEDAGAAIYLLTNGGTSETMVLTNTQGTSDAAIDINATAGGVDIDAGKSVNITSAEAQADAVVIAASTAVGGIDITSNADIDITTTGAAGEDISLVNTGGSIVLSATEAIADAVSIAASAGGIDLTSAATFDIDITATGGKVLVTPSEAAADQFKVDATGVVAGYAVVLETSDGGVQINADGAANGDIAIDAADDMTLTAAGDLTTAVTGTLTVTGSFVYGGVQDIAAGGTTTAVVLTNQVVTVGADAGGDIVTIANGTAGQILYLICADASGTTTITPATFNGGTSITFDAVGDSVTLVYVATLGWSIVGGNSYTIVA